jgi:hypothetical protein
MTLAITRQVAFLDGYLDYGWIRQNGSPPEKIFSCATARGEQANCCAHMHRGPATAQAADWAYPAWSRAIIVISLF